LTSCCAQLLAIGEMALLRGQPGGMSTAKAAAVLGSRQESWLTMDCIMEFFVWLDGRFCAHFKAASGSCCASWDAMVESRLFFFAPEGRFSA
jgi:hypothetical protein